jgi:hypothetical protein
MTLSTEKNAKGLARLKHVLAQPYWIFFDEGRGFAMDSLVCGADCLPEARAIAQIHIDNNEAAGIFERDTGLQYILERDHAGILADSVDEECELIPLMTTDSVTGLETRARQAKETRENTVMLAELSALDPAKMSSQTRDLLRTLQASIGEGG